ncbi:HtaA domain-containing protein [Streptomyces sp. FIT100]|uniref:HtaA domain-containing protein n=1 Tax=Streptomyces sp. FIT100 TaxID=2837956 RepID=UPI0021C93DFE|nr:HtaA domain-containing protein [Streptomyces sp. FIT100]UUN26571.1 HtaA domain-containing protein [Streptomyces sp. FIT100]
MAVVRRPVALGAVIATAVALGATGFAALPALAAGSAAAPAAAPKLEIVDGTLDWGLKESFRKYVAGPIAHGSVSVADGATQAAGNGVFTFTGGKGTYDTATHASETAFKGSVHCLGHGGVLDVKVGDIKVATGATAGTVTADFTSKKMDGTVVTKDDAVIADLDLTGIAPGQGEGGATVLANIPAKLTADGAEAFAGFYQAGTALDPATLSVKAAAPSPSPTGSPSSSPSPTGSPSSSPSPTGSPSSSPSPTDDPSTTPSAPADGTIVDGNLDWGLKESFRTYVVGPIAGGKVELADGAVRNGEIYRFTKAGGSFDAGKQNLSAEFDGSVRFLGHKEADGTYVLDLKLSGLQTQVKNGKGTLVADVSSKDRETHKVSTFEDLPLASLDLPDGKLSAKDGVVTLSDVPASLTADGAQAFAGFYEAGTELDKVSLSVALDEDAELPGGTGGSTGGGTGGSSSGGSTGGTTGTTTGGGTVGGSAGGGSLASTGSELPAGALLAASGAVAAAGAGVVVAVRRRQSAPQS